MSLISLKRGVHFISEMSAGAQFVIFGVLCISLMVTPAMGQRRRGRVKPNTDRSPDTFVESRQLLHSLKGGGCVNFQVSPEHEANGRYVADDGLADCSQGMAPRYKLEGKNQYLYWFYDSIFKVNRWQQGPSIFCLPVSPFFCVSDNTSVAGSPAGCWKQGLFGVQAEVNVTACADPCLPNPCVHGTCTVDTAFNANCTCDKGWTGALCEEVGPDCVVFDAVSPPAANGVYRKTSASGPCSRGGRSAVYRHTEKTLYLAAFYDPVFKVSRWQISADLTCQASIFNYFCESDRWSPASLPASCWRYGLFAVPTQANVTLCPDPCSPNPCENGGNCTADFNNDYQCTCQTGFTGVKCEEVDAECVVFDSTSPIDAIGTYRKREEFKWPVYENDTLPNCSLKGRSSVYRHTEKQIYLFAFYNPIYKVTRWQVSVTPACSPLSNFACASDRWSPVGLPGSCWTDGFLGFPVTSNITVSQCVDPCLANPCVNGKCTTDFSNDYYCTCDEGWTGRNCEEVEPECIVFETEDAHYFAGVFRKNDKLPVCSNDRKSNYKNVEKQVVMKPRYEHTEKKVYLHSLYDRASKVHRWQVSLYPECVPVYDLTCATEKWSPLNMPKSCWKRGLFQTNYNVTISQCPDVCKDNPCVNGNCSTNIKNEFVCTCEPGWTGERCEEVDPDCIVFKSESPVPADGVYTRNNSLPACSQDGNPLYRHEGEDRPRLGRYKHATRNLFLYSYYDSVYKIHRWQVSAGGVVCPSLASLYCDSDHWSPLSLPASCWKGGLFAAPHNINISQCDDKPTSSSVIHGNCNGLFGICTCDPGWTGSNCTQAVLECASAPCQNNGACREGNNGFVCTCKDGFLGPSCSLTEWWNPLGLLTTLGSLFGLFSDSP